MSDSFLDALSPRQLSARFDLLAADAKEYAIFLLEEDGRLICWNPGAERLFGFPSTEVVGRHFSRFFSPEDVRNGQPEYELKTALADGCCNSARWQVRKDGSTFWASGSTVCLRAEDGTVRGFAKILRDIPSASAWKCLSRK